MQKIGMRRSAGACVLVTAAGIAACAPAAGQITPVILRPTSQYPGGVEAAAADAKREAFAGRFRDDRHIVGCGKAEMLRLRGAAGFQIDEDQAVIEQLREAYTDTDLLNCNLDIEIIPSAVSPNPNIIGSNIMTVRSNVNGLTEFSFMLRSNFTATAKLNGSASNAPLASFGSYGRRVTLDRAYNAGEVFTVRVDYSGFAVSRGFGSIDFVTQNGQPLVTTLSQPYFAATWWPVKDGDFGAAGDNADKFTIQIGITAPTAMRSVANGTLQGIDVLSGNRRRHRWASNYPIPPYLVAFGSTNYNTYTTMWNYTPPGGGAPISMPFEINLYPASDTVANRNAWNRSVAMLTTFSNLYGTYPFAAEKYGMYQVNFSGGMEHQTNTAQGTFNESVTAHELAHQWWGDMVTCRFWNDIWLNEGAATYGECIWAERQAGGVSPAALINALNARKPPTGSGAVYKTDTSNVNTLFDSNTTYNKGAWVWHMLRRQVGDTVFFGTILPEWRARYQYSAATTNDLASMCSELLGTPMQYFFNQWVFGTGEPAYTSGFQGFSVNGQNYIRLVVNQTQSTAFGANQRFIMPLDVQLGASSGSPVVRVQNDARNEWYVIPVSAVPGAVVLDPATSILTSSKTATAYTNGPAKVLSAAPVMGSTTIELAGVADIRVGFSENVSAAAGDFVITGPSGTVPFALAYNPANWTATLTPGAALGAGVYTVTVRDTIATTAAGIRLDGEIANPNAASSLPSGDGQALGNAVLSFRVRCTADINDDSVVDLADFFEFLNQFDVTDPAADLNKDTAVDLADFFGFLNAFDQNC